MMTRRTRLLLTALVISTGCDADRPARPEPEPPPTEVPGEPHLLAIVPSKSRIDAGTSAQFGVQATDAQHRPVPATGVQWASSDVSVARVTQAGTVTGVSPGYVRISAVARTASAYTMVHVQRDGVYPDLVVIEPATSSLSACGSLSLAARTVPDVGSPLFSWRSTDTLVARVDASGMVQGRAEGTAAITALWLPDTSRRATRELRVTPC